MVFSIATLIPLVEEDNLIQKETSSSDSGEEKLLFYYNSTRILSHTFTFDSTKVTVGIYADIQWKPHDSDEYELNISMHTHYPSSSSDYDIIIFKGIMNKYEFFGAIELEGVNYDYNFTKITYDDDYEEAHGVNDSDYEDSFFITYFSMKKMEKIDINVNITCKHTHNSDSGDNTATGDMNYNLTLSDPTHNDDLQIFCIVFLFITLIAAGGLVITFGIIFRRINVARYSFYFGK